MLNCRLIIADYFLSATCDDLYPTPTSWRGLIIPIGILKSILRLKATQQTEEKSGQLQSVFWKFLFFTLFPIY